MKKAFTLLELMVVIGIMASLSTMAIGGYRALQRGMEDRAAVVEVQSLVDLAVQRSEIDRRPSMLYFYDEMLQEDDEDNGRDFVARGIVYAIRPVGRITRVDGELLYDEFGDLDQIYTSSDEQDEDQQDSSNDKMKMRFYLMDAAGKYFEASPTIVSQPFDETFLMTGQGETTGGDSGKQIPGCAFRWQGGQKPKVGDAYGVEYAVRTLPNGYLFGASASTSVGRKQVSTMTITANGNGAQGVSIYRCKPGSTQTDKAGTTSTRN